MTRKKVIIGFITLFLIIVSYIFIQFNKANNIEQTCFASDFTETFNEETNIRLNEVYNFSEIFNCESWDEIIIVGGKRVNRAAIFIKEGVALPPIDYENSKVAGSLVFFLIKEGKLVSSPISFRQRGFLYFKDFNSFDYISLDKENAVFKCIELETIGFEETMLTFKLINDSSNVSN